MATRKIFVIQSDNEKIGKVAIVCVGMAEVSCCINTVNIGCRVQKGDQMGYFKFGGSSHALIFEKKANLKFKVENRVPGESSETKFGLQKVKSYLAHIEWLIDLWNNWFIDWLIMIEIEHNLIIWCKREHRAKSAKLIMT